MQLIKMSILQLNQQEKLSKEDLGLEWTQLIDKDAYID